MPTENEYEQQVKLLDHAKLLALWDEIKARNTPDWADGKAFEYLILRAFELEGATVVYPFSVPLHDEIVEQIDGAVYAEGISAIIESKDFAEDKKVNVEPIAKMRNQLLRRPASTVGMIFSRTGFTLPSLTLSRFLSPQTILIWQGDEIEKAFKEQKLVRGFLVKYRMTIQRGQNDFSLLTPGAI